MTLCCNRGIANGSTKSRGGRMTEKHRGTDVCSGSAFPKTRVNQKSLRIPSRSTKWRCHTRCCIWFSSLGQSPCSVSRECQNHSSLDSKVSEQCPKSDYREAARFKLISAKTLDRRDQRIAHVHRKKVEKPPGSFDVRETNSLQLPFFASERRGGAAT